MASPLLGYNTNVRHHGKLFHIQTEDSGIQHGHIFTHLFADGGRIIATKKTTYSQWIGTEKFAATVKKLMQAQHKAMFVALRDGLFDADEAAGARAFAAKEITLDDEGASEPKTGEVKVDAAVHAPPAPAAAPHVPSAPPPPASVPPRAATMPPPVAIDGQAAAPPAIDGPETAPVQRAEDSDFDRAAEDYRDTIPGAEPAPEIPSVQQVTARTPSGSHSRPLRPASGGHPRPDVPSPGRYQMTQPVARKKSAPIKPSESLFGQDLVSEKSLDEVIMGYLADDLDGKE